MSLLISNSRDIGNKFLFGHFMMHKQSSIPFIGPGYGRVNYWMKSNNNKSLDDIIDQEMFQMRNNGLKAYVIELCGRLEAEDGCWQSCKNDKGGSFDPETGEVNYNEATSGYFSTSWYSEVFNKYKQLIKLCQKYNLWLLTLIYNDNRIVVASEDKLADWIEEYKKPDTTEERKEELRLAISDAVKHYISSKLITYDNIKKLIESVVIPCGGKERVVLCPSINSSSNQSSIGYRIEKDYIPILKGKGFATCSDGSKKYDARLFETYRDNSSVKDGIGISCHERMIREIYDKELIEDIKGNTTAKPDKVKQVISKYKAQNANAAFLYAWVYGANGNNPVDTNALKAIQEGWR